MSDVANVQVYVCPISRVPNNHLILSHYLSFLNATEKLRYDQYHSHAARLFLISRVLMKSVLSDKLGILPHEVIIQLQPNGKPLYEAIRLFILILVTLRTLLSLL